MCAHELGAHDLTVIVLKFRRLFSDPNFHFHAGKKLISQQQQQQRAFKREFAM